MSNEINIQALLGRLRAVSETGCDPDLPHEAADAIAELHAERDALAARQAPAAQPVNARMLEALLYWRDECSGAEPSIRAFSRIVDDAIAAAESAPEAVRLTEAERFDLVSGWVKSPQRILEEFAAQVETAVLRKNGIEVKE